MHQLRWLIALAVASCLVGCNQNSLPNVEKHDPARHPFLGCWHLFVAIDDYGPHHEYYEILPDNSVTACFLAVDDILMARFQGRLQGNEVVGENSDVRFSLRRDRESLIIRDKHDCVFTRIDSLPAACRIAPEWKGAMRKKNVVSLTPAALDKVRELKPRNVNSYVRVGVVRGGSTGYMYDLQFDDRFHPDGDFVDVLDGITVLVDKTSAIFIQGASIDWQTTDDGKQGFHFDNPNAVANEPN